MERYHSMLEQIIKASSQVILFNENFGQQMFLNSWINTRKKEGRHFFHCFNVTSFILKFAEAQFFFLFPFPLSCTYMRVCKPNTSKLPAATHGRRQTITFADGERGDGGGGWGCNGSWHCWPSSRSSKWRHDIANDVTHARMCVPWVCCVVERRTKERERDFFFSVKALSRINNEGRHRGPQIGKTTRARPRKAAACRRCSSAATISKKVWENLNVSVCVWVGGCV